MSTRQQPYQLSFDPSDLTSQLSTKQEDLFQGLVHFHIIDLATYEHAVEEAETMTEGIVWPAAGKYMEQQKLMLNLQVRTCACMYEGVILISLKVKVL